MLFILFILVSRLFSSVPADAFSGPTISALLALFDNYDENCKVTEVITNEEQTENDVFLDAILATSVFQQAHEFLVSKGNHLKIVKFTQKKNFNFVLIYPQNKFQVWLMRISLFSRNICDSSGWANTTAEVESKALPAWNTFSWVRRTETAFPAITDGSSITATNWLAR